MRVSTGVMEIGRYALCLGAKIIKSFDLGLCSLRPIKLALAILAMHPKF